MSIDASGCKVAIAEQIQKQTSMEKRYYISFYIQGDASSFNDLVRGRGIENQFHWDLDVIFSEDASRACNGNTPMNLNILRKMPLQRVRQMPHKLSLQKRRFRAAL